MLGKEKNEPTFVHVKDPLCEIEECKGAVHRDNVCLFHLAQRVEKNQARQAKDQERSFHRMAQKNWPEKVVEGMFQSANRVCSWCGTSGEGLLNVVKKSKDRMPKKPGSYAETLRVLCNSCLKAGR